MKKITILLVIIFTFLFSTTSWGEWSFVVDDVKGDSYSGEDDGGKFYYDKDRIRKSGKYLYFWMLKSFPNHHAGTLSFTSYVELDCSIFRSKMLKLQTYNSQMGKGKKLREFTFDKWRYPEPNSSFEVILNTVCERSLGEVVYWGIRNGKFGFYTEKWEGVESEDNKDMTRYEGEIKYGEPNGYGKFTESNGGKYEGELKMGFPNGQGTGISPDGVKEVGEYKMGKFVNGTKYDKNGNITDKYVNGKMIKQ